MEYNTPHCHKEASWVNGAGWIGSTILKANLSYNSISKLTDLSTHVYLLHLNLDHNQLTTITGLSSCLHLEYLSIAHNALTSTKGVHGLKITELILHHNKISSLVELETCPYLSKVDFSYNAITGVEDLYACKGVQTINLSGNPIRKLMTLNGLQACKLLSELSLNATPLTKKEHYRPNVLVRLPNLTVLDEIVASSKERVSAYHMFGGDLEVGVFRFYLNYNLNFLKHQ